MNNLGRLGKFFTKRIVETSAEVFNDISSGDFVSITDKFKLISGSDGNKYFTGTFNGDILNFFTDIYKDFSNHKGDKFSLDESGLSIVLVKDQGKRIEVTSYDLFELVQELTRFLDDNEESELKNFKFRGRPDKEIRYIELPLNVLKESLK